MTSYDLICKGIFYLQLAVNKLEEESHRSRFNSPDSCLRENYVQSRLALYQAQRLLQEARETAASVAPFAMETCDLPSLNQRTN